MARKIVEKSGLTIVELVVVMAIMSIVAIIAIPRYNKWARQYSIESDIKTIYGIIQSERTKAFSQKLDVIISFNGNNMSVVEKDGLSGSVLDNYTDTFKNKFYGGPIYIDTRGTLSGLSVYHNSIIQGLSPQYDCITIDDVRVSLGKWDGTNCKAE